VTVVDVFNASRTPIDVEAVERLVDAVLVAEGVDDAELAVEFVGEARIRELNREHRERDEVTDVLSFPLEDADEAPQPGDPAPRLLGDVLVCARQALRQAEGDGLPPAFELAVLLVHGTLHLLGYDHEADAGQMLVRQAEIMERIQWEGLIAPPR
jgi:probable rRNA maturation factor